MRQKKLATISRQLIENRPVSEPELELGREKIHRAKIQSMLAETQEFGFSEAEAVAGPMGTPEPECGCPQCSLKYQTSGKDLTFNGAPQ